MSYIEYANQGATRNQSLSPQLTQALGFLPDLGVTARVFSGGQPSTGNNRVGSTRHDHGDAADVLFFQGGRQLDWRNPEDVPIYQQIVSRGRAAGLTGFGAGENYMTPGSMHIGFGNPAVWGEDGRGANAAQWLRDAYQGAPAGQAPTNTQATGVQMDGTQQSSGELSRNQRMMLGFAALRDAGAALQGQNSNFFADTMGGFQQQAQAEDDRAFRQMQFDRGVTEFDIAQAGSQAERDLRREQEQRLIDERNQQTQMDALQGLARIRQQRDNAAAVARATGQRYVDDPTLLALEAAYTRQLIGAGEALDTPTGGTPTGGTPPIVPAAGDTPPILPATGVPATGDTPTGAPAMTVDAAAAIIDTPGSSADEIRAARTYLENLPQSVVSGVGETRISSLLGRSGAAIEAAETSAVAAANAAQTAEDFKFYGSRVADFLIEGYEGGEPVYNPALMTRPGRISQAVRQTPEYQAFNNALGFIANNLTFEKMASMKAAGITFGSLSNEELQQVARTASTLDVNDPIGTYDALRRIEDSYGIDLGLGGAAPTGEATPQGASSEMSDEDLLEFYLGGGQ